MMSREGQMLTEFGIEGVDWEYNSDGTVNAFALDNDRKVELGYGTYQWFAKREQFTPATPLWVQAYVDELKTMAEPNFVHIATETGAERGTILKDLVKQSEADLIITPDIDFDAKFDEYIQKWNEYGGAQWTEEMNAQYQQLQK